MNIKLHNEWIVGFVDGEGCFSFSIFRNEGMRSGYQIQGEFTVVQHIRDIQVLHALKEHFGCGSVAVNHGDRYHYRVKNLAHLLLIIIPFFERYPLNTQTGYPVFEGPACRP
jgi:LAGLIDADG endonuclease